LRCGHFGVLTAETLPRLAIAPTAPIAAFVKRLRCRRCGSQSVLATRKPARSIIGANPAVLKGAARSDVNTKGDLGSCSRCRRRRAHSSSPTIEWRSPASLCEHAASPKRTRPDPTAGPQSVRWVRGVQADGDVHGPRDHVSPTRASPVDASELSGLPNNPVGSYPIGALRGMAAAFFVSLAFLNRRNT
jgi:hypothetical protein